MALIDPPALVERFARRREGPHTAPTLIERALTHLLYAAGLLMPLRAILATKAKIASLTMNTMYSSLMALLLAALALLVWCALVRRSPPARWYLSHVTSLGLTFGIVLMAVVAAPIVMFVGLLFTAVFQPFAYIAVYGPFAIAVIALAWLSYRMVRGYIRFLDGIGADGQEHDSAAVTKPQEPR